MGEETMKRGRGLEEEERQESREEEDNEFVSRHASLLVNVRRGEREN